MWPLADGDEVAIVTETDERGLYTIRHSTAHVLAQAVLDLFPGATFAIGPPVENGFYYDFELPDGGTFTPEDLDRIDARMREIIAENQPFIRDEIAEADALELFARPQVQARDHRAARPTTRCRPPRRVSVRTYENPPRFIDLCRGPHVPDTGRLGHFKLMRVAGAYWRGDEKQPDAAAHLRHGVGVQEGARGLPAPAGGGREARPPQAGRRARPVLSFPDELGGGLAVWHPKGGHGPQAHGGLLPRAPRARRLRLRLLAPHRPARRCGRRAGTSTSTPTACTRPWRWTTAEYYPKPMNCPFHILIFQSRQRSYRELPLRLFELGTVYRYERSGTLHGLMRVRGFTQDDAHIFCTPDQVVDEVTRRARLRALDLLRGFGFDDFEAQPLDPARGEVGRHATRSGTRPPRRPARRARAGPSSPYEVDEGGGAFYGPKIDVQGPRRHRPHVAAVHHPGSTSTSPSASSIDYVGADNDSHRPVMIHRALFGSIERFFGVLLEHYAGAFPAWLAPVQVRVLPVRDDHDVYARRLVDRLDGRRLPGRHGRGRRAPGRPHPQGQAREAAVHPRGRRRRRRALHRRGEPSRGRGRAGRPGRGLRRAAAGDVISHV